jgi:hypothetical protein
MRTGVNLRYMNFDDKTKLTSTCGDPPLSYMYLAYRSAHCHGTVLLKLDLGVDHQSMVYQPVR